MNLLEDEFIITKYFAKLSRDYIISKDNANATRNDVSNVLSDTDQTPILLVAADRNTCICSASYRELIAATNDRVEFHELVDMGHFGGPKIAESIFHSLAPISERVSWPTLKFEIVTKKIWASKENSMILQRDPNVIPKPMKVFTH